MAPGCPDSRCPLRLEFLRTVPRAAPSSSFRNHLQLPSLPPHPHPQPDGLKFLFLQVWRLTWLSDMGGGCGTRGFSEEPPLHPQATTGLAYWVEGRKVLLPVLPRARPTLARGSPEVWGCPAQGQAPVTLLPEALAVLSIRTRVLYHAAEKRRKTRRWETERQVRGPANPQWSGSARPWATLTWSPSWGPLGQAKPRWD